MIDFTVQFQTVLDATTSVEYGLVRGIQMNWCELIDTSKPSLGCVESGLNSHPSKIFSDPPAFNPFKKDESYWTLSMGQIEVRDDLDRFESSQISRIDLCEFTTSTGRIGGL